MALKKPESMDECVYFSNRSIGKGRAMAWVYRAKCPKCDGRLGKPIKKDGKIDKKSEFYVCYKCGYSAEVKDIDPQLKVEIDYVCPYCAKEGEATTEYKRKTWQGAKAYVFECAHCGKKIGITKKLKQGKDF